MPKSDLLQLIDQRPSGVQSSGVVSHLATERTNADTVDNLHASLTPLPFTLFPLGDDAKFSPSVLPNIQSSGQATGAGGMIYFGPRTYLAAPIGLHDKSLLTIAPIFGSLDSAVLSHYSNGDVEYIWITGGPYNDGANFRYNIERQKRGKEAREWPQWTEIIGMGSTLDGGYIYAQSAEGPDSPHLTVREAIPNDPNRAYRWKGTFGRLSVVPDDFKALFPWVTEEEWKTMFGVAAIEGFFAGSFAAESGYLNNLDIRGLLTIRSDRTLAKMEIGRTASGFGQVFRSSEGAPIWLLTAPYENQQEETEVLWAVESMGTRAIWFRYVPSNDPEADSYWALDVGPFTTTREGFFASAEGEMPGGGIYGDRTMQFRMIPGPDVWIGTMHIFEQPYTDDGETVPVYFTNLRTRGNSTLQFYHSLSNGDTVTRGGLSSVNGLRHTGETGGATAANANPAVTFWARYTYSPRGDDPNAASMTVPAGWDHRPYLPYNADTRTHLNALLAILTQYGFVYAATA